MSAYRIKDWNEHFENNKSRERDACSWCAIPNKQDGLGYGRLLRRKNGAALYGAFVAVVLTASKQKRPRDGHLTDTGRADGCPYTADDLSVKTQIPVSLITEMLDAVSDVSIGWIECYGDSARRVPAECPPSALEGKGREGIEEKEICDSWNVLAVDAGLSKINNMTSTRIRQLKTRLLEYPNFWQVLQREIPMLSDFARGVDGKNTWRLDFDFCLTPAGFTKLSEGKYRTIAKKVPFENCILSKPENT